MIKLLLFVSFCVLASTVSGQSCQFSCNEYSHSPGPQTPPPSLLRGKRGVKGEKGEVGGIGAERLEEIGGNKEKIERLEKVVAEQSEIISLLTSLTICDLPALDHIKTNSSVLLRHNQVAQLSCDKPNKGEGESVRTCQMGSFKPSFKESPFECFSLKYVFVEKQLTTTEAQQYCATNYNHGNLVMDGIDTIEQRKQICNDVGATPTDTYIHIGFIRDYVEDNWKRFDSGSMDNFIFDWHPSYPKNRVYLQMSCRNDGNFGTVWDNYADYKCKFVCQYY